MLRDRPTAAALKRAAADRQKAPFLRILSEGSSSTHPAIRRRHDVGRRNALPVGTPAGAAVPPAGRCRSRNSHHERGFRTDTDCSGNGFGDKLTHRVEVQAPQPWLHAGLKKHNGSPAPIGLAPNRQALIRTPGRRTGDCIQPPSSARRGVRSLISYQAQIVNHTDCSVRLHPRLDPSLGKLWSRLSIANSRLDRFTGSRALRLHSTAFPSAHLWQRGSWGHARFQRRLNAGWPRTDHGTRHCNLP